jgi:hypothetical protein
MPPYGSGFFSEVTFLSFHFGDPHTNFLTRSWILERPVLRFSRHRFTELSSAVKRFTILRLSQRDLRLCRCAPSFLHFSSMV